MTKRSAFDDLIERGVSEHRAGNFDAALRAYHSALDLRPNDAEASSLYGLALVRTGAFEAAERALRKAVALEPDQVGFRLNLVELFERTQRYDDALEALDAVTARSPKLARGWEKRGDVHVLLERHAGARDAFARALALDPGNHAIALKLTRVCVWLADAAGARQALNVVMRRRPDDEATRRLHLEVLTLTRDWPALETLSRAWLAADANHTVAWRSLSQALFEQGRNRESMNAYAKSLPSHERSADTLTRLARLCMHAHEFDRAATALDDAERLDPMFIEMLAAKGLLLTYFGRLVEAERYCRHCLAANSDYVPVYTQLSRLTRGRLSERELETVARLSTDGQIPLEHRMSAAFVLADGYDARGQYDAAFASYQSANGLARTLGDADGFSYDSARTEARIERIIGLFGAPSAVVAPSASPRLIFIVGMPRSGTTLVESMLAAHSRVVAGGERTLMPQLLRSYLAQADDPAAGAPSREVLEQWAAAYHGGNPTMGGADHLTDKHPLNFEAAGLIATLFPNALIVHVRRSPVETGLSVFRHGFTKFWPFAHRLEDIGHYYGQYARLVAHWERVLGDRFTTVQYEDFATHFERAAPALVRACRLDWETECLDFQSSPRPIATLSAVQARGAVAVQLGKAQRYGEHLAPLIATLDAAHVDLTTGAIRATTDPLGVRSWLRRRRGPKKKAN